MKQIRRKLFLSIFMLFVTVVTLTSTTFAWFSRNQEAWTDELDIDIESTDDLLISVDGNKFYSSISNQNLRKAIVSKMTGIDINSEEMTKEFINEEFKKLSLSSVTTSDLINFKTLNPSDIKEIYPDNETDNSSDKGEIEYKYQLKDAEKTSYISFDLYFRVTSTKKNDKMKDYYLTFVDKEYATENEVLQSYIKMNETEVLLHNDLSTTDTEYHSGDVIKVNPVNALRIGIKTETQSILYEPYIGLGSYAIADEEELIYNPNKNAMLTYFNNTHEAQLDPISENKEFYKNSEKNFDGLVSFDKFTFNKETQKYNDVKITVSVWIEGFDSDYFMGIENNKLTMMLNFIKREVA